jgi:SAM-dependent methyltransferase
MSTLGGQRGGSLEPAASDVQQAQEGRLTKSHQTGLNASGRINNSGAAEAGLSAPARSHYYGAERPGMRDNVEALVQLLGGTVEVPEPIVEIGSLQVEGQVGFADMRPSFLGKAYIGCDMRPGPGVDRIENVERLTFSDETVGTVLMLDTLEHVADCHRATHEAHRVLRPGGLLLMVSVMDFEVHLHPSDYWRFTPQAFELLLGAYSPRWVFLEGNPLNPHTVIGLGIKNGGAAGVPGGLDAFLARLRERAMALTDVDYDDPALARRYPFNDLHQGYILLAEAHRQIATLSEQLMEARRRLAEPIARPGALDASLGWRLLERYRRLRAAWLPPATRRGRLYETLLRRFR